MPALKHFAIRSDDGKYSLSIEADDGTKMELSATFEQLDLVAEELDAILDQDEETALSED